MHDSVYEIAGNDPRKAKLLRASLQKLADQPDGLLKEMAEQVLRGELDLRQAAMSDTYGQPLGVAFDQFTTYYDELDQHERDELVADTQQQLNELLDDSRTAPS
ncbi:hypothetical protein [Paractinoplanes toevensis]|uniref:Uncharacterized protein n=1 Tax=Paractinoplanes toevensis TaxID=571911 RepID=A0A920BRB1_9ACTN|nr:hypothetical protein [Actinoplanes toevensis]GIM98232.1 hypothetical protein Ato02nite_100250 [Actinoplanes toevensis]